jgi:hypothetical protein
MNMAMATGMATNTSTNKVTAIAIAANMLTVIITATVIDMQIMGRQLLKFQLTAWMAKF